MFRMDPGRLHEALEQLEKAAHDHADWHDNLIRTIVCRLPCDPRDLSQSAHHECRFGQWYYEQAAAELRAQPAFASMETEHRRLHSIAAQLLRETAGGAPIVREDYDALVAVSGQLHLELESLRHDIEGALRSHDPLTGAYGRIGILPELREWRELAKRNVQQCCVVFMDLDHLKEINDRYGHIVGDQVLIGAVRYVTEHLRPYDKMFRYGGDEFLITLPGADLPGGQHLIERIREGFGRTPFVVTADGQEIHATASFGLAQLEPDLCVEESIDRADKALLLAKTAGRDRAINWDPSIRTGTMLNWGREEEAAG